MPLCLKQNTKSIYNIIATSMLFKIVVSHIHCFIIYFEIHKIIIIKGVERGCAKTFLDDSIL